MASSNWQHKICGSSNRYLYMFRNGILNDCKFLVGRKNDQKEIAAHKIILASVSPVFETMFYGSLPEKDKPILIPEVHPATFTKMLEYIYSDQLNIKSPAIACGLYYLADKYMIPELAKQCIEFLFINIQAINACRIYDFANLFNLVKLKEKCIEVFKFNTQQILQHTNFLDISMTSLITILEQDSLDINSELDLFYALERLAKKRVLFENESDRNSESDSASSTANDEIYNCCYGYDDDDDDDDYDDQNPNIDPLAAAIWGMYFDRLNTCPNNPNTEPTATFTWDLPTSNPCFDRWNTCPTGISNQSPNWYIRPPTFFSQNLQNTSLQRINVNNSEHRNSSKIPIEKEQFRLAVKKIRFLTMTTDEFGRGPANSKLLTDNEKLTFIKMIAQPYNIKISVPEGFSNSRTKRVQSRIKGGSFNNILC